jgi:hypothetical protein
MKFNIPSIICQDYIKKKGKQHLLNLSNNNNNIQNSAVDYEY